MDNAECRMHNENLLSGLVCSFLRFFYTRETVFQVSLMYVSIGLSSRTASRKVFSPLQSLTSVFGMGTGGPSAFEALTYSQ